MNRFALLVCVGLLCPALDTAQAGGCCDHCGCQAHCRKVCRPVCEWKEVTETCYGCECEDICVPGCSRKVCTKTECTDCCDPCGPHKYTIWKPSCGNIKTVSKMVKYEVTRKVPVITWVVESVCDNCCNHCGGGNDDAGQQPVEAAADAWAPQDGLGSFSISQPGIPAPPTR